MVRIPRAEPSLAPQIAMQPGAVGSGWGAPGRATVQLGQSIASLGDALGDMAGSIDAEANKEADFKDNMLMLKTETNMGINQVETQQTYSGDGEDYLPSRTQYYDETTSGAIAQMQPRNQQRAALFFEKRKGPYLESDAKFGGQRRQATLMSTINEAVTTEYGKLATVPPEEFEQRFQETVRGIDLIIGGAPLPDTLREEATTAAAKRGYDILKGMAEDPETAPEIVPKIMRMIEEPEVEVEQAPVEPEALQPIEPPQPGAEGVQGLPGGPSGKALAPPQKLGAADVAPPEGQEQAVAQAPVKYQILDTVAPTHTERNRIFRKGGVVVNLDTNWASGDKPTTPMVVIPDNATKAQKDAAQAYAGQVAQLYRQKFGVDLKPKVVSRSKNGRGRPSTIHTEPYAVTDSKAVAFFQTPEGVAAHAQILRDTFGKVPGVVFSIPHDPTRRGDHGAEANGVNEVGLAKLVLAQLKSGDAGPPLQQFAGMSKLGAGDVVPSEARAPNTIPGEPQLVQGPELVRGEPDLVRVADASGKFVPAQRTQTWRSVDSKLRGLLIENMGEFKKMEAEASRKEAQIAEEKTKIAREGTEREGLELLFGRKLTRQWVEQNGPLLSNDMYSRLMGAVTPKSRVTDPVIYTELLEKADEKPEESIADAMDAYGSGQLDQRSFERIYGKAQRAMSPDTKRPPWVSEYRNMMKRAIRPAPGDKTVDSMKSYGDALEKFDDFVDEQKAAGKEMDRKAVQGFAEQTVKEYKLGQVADRRKSLSMPRFSQVSREAMTMEEVDAAVQRTIEAAKSNKIRPEELKIEAANLRKWKEAMEAEAVAKGEKIPPPKPAKRESAPQKKPAQQEQPSQSEDLGGGGFDPPMRLGGPKEQQQKPQQETRPVGGALGVIPLAEDAEGNVQLSVPGMLLEPFRAFMRGWERQNRVGSMSEDGRMYTASDAARDSSEDAAIAAGVPMAGTTIGSAVGMVPKGALGSGMARTGEAAAAREISPSGYYSGLDEAFKGLKPTDSVTAETLAKRGVKQAEIEAHGLSDLLSEGKSAKVSDLQRVAGENRVEVREGNYGKEFTKTTSGEDLARSKALREEIAALDERIGRLGSSEREPNGWFGRQGETRSALETRRATLATEWRSLGSSYGAKKDLNAPKWQEHSLDPSNPTYRETVLHLPANRTMQEISGPSTLAELSANAARKADDFRTGHWDEPNVIAHLRTSIQKDSEGKDVFVVNELQSDWGQKLDDDMKLAYARDMFKASKYDDLSKEQKAQISKAIDADRKTGTLKGGARDEAKIAELAQKAGAAEAAFVAINDEAQAVLRGKLSEFDLRLAKDNGDAARAHLLNHGHSDLESRHVSARSELMRLRAELDTAEASSPGHPLVNTTDQWVNTGLRKAIMQAVESGADQIAIPSGETVKAYKMGGGEKVEKGNAYAYNEMYPKNLRNLLKKIDPSIEPTVVPQLFGKKGEALERSHGFITFKITPKLREAVKKEGMPLFTGGVPIYGADGGESD